MNNEETTGTKLKTKEEIYCDDDRDRSGIEECKTWTEDLFKESVWYKE
jgi:hypothetical protein